ncbi:ankyrin repeat-containing domain protein, partial [Baffinella frigidus]
WTPLQEASFSNDSDELERLLSIGVDIDELDSNGGTALHYASSANNTYWIKELLMHGANPSIKNNEGRIPHQV